MYFNSFCLFDYFQNIGIPIKDRYDEFQWRPAAFDELGHSIQHVRKFLDLCSQKVMHSS